MNWKMLNFIDRSCESGGWKVMDILMFEECFEMRLEFESGFEMCIECVA